MFKYKGGKYKMTKDKYKIGVTAPDTSIRDVIENVTEVKFCKDGRIFIHFDKPCKQCNGIEKMIKQVPKGYTIQNLTGGKE